MWSTGRGSVASAVALVVLVALVPVAPPAGALTIDSHNVTEVRAITFPVEGPTTYSPDFLAPRSGGRRHAGIDIFGEKLQHLVAARDGVVDRLSDTASGLSGNYLVLRDAQGWEYAYIHINNDTPDTDDGANPPEWRFAPGIGVGSSVKAGQFIAYLGDSGNAETTPSHTHFEIRRPNGTQMNPWPSLRTAQGQPVGSRCVWSRNPRSEPDMETNRGAWAVTDVGEVLTFGGAPFFGDASAIDLNAPVVGLAPTPTGDGYWLLAEDGGVFSYGDATFHGSTGSLVLNEPVVGMAATPTGGGYWLVASDGGIFAFGDARFWGSMGGQHLNEPVVGMDPTADGAGYRMIATDGGVFAFGDAPFVGSLPGEHIDDFIIGLTAPTDRDGYWLLNDQGGIYPFGAVDWYGSVQAGGLCEPREGAAVTVSAGGEGYWILTTKGDVFSFGDAALLTAEPLTAALRGRPIALAARPGAVDEDPPATGDDPPATEDPGAAAASLGPDGTAGADVDATVLGAPIRFPDAPAAGPAAVGDR